MSVLWAPRLSRIACVVFAAIAAFLAAAGAASSLAWRQYVAGLGPIDLEVDSSTQVVDRNGILLRPFALPDGRWRLPATTRDVDPRYLAMLLACEDRRFYEHDGVDPRALLRAAM
ncbi:MAG TPA: transglycosylase domain-containing protein, partial [Roseiarcus sp.]|nr:transglycosylase domain-containing protein [Roseiarcus sp.]